MTKHLMDLADAYANVVVCRFVGTAPDAKLLAAVEAQAAELETLRSNYNSLKKMVDEGGVHERILSAGIEQEREIKELKAELEVLRSMHKRIDAVLAAPVAPQQEPISVYRLTKHENGVWLPASEWLTGYPDPSWDDLVANEPELWSIQRRVTGKQIADGFARALAQPVAQPAEAPDCRTCDYYVRFEGCTRNEKFGRCTNGDKYQPAPKVVLWRTE
jgi:hypothetical protein